jgi:quinol monooxygenase YgiN
MYFDTGNRMMSDYVAWVLELKIKPGQADAFRSLLDEMVASTENEPGALNYEWHIDDAGEIVHVYERYVDSAAVLAHSATFREKFAARVMNLADITRMTVYGNPNDAVRATLGGGRAVVMQPFGGFTR